MNCVEYRPAANERVTKIRCTGQKKKRLSGAFFARYALVPAVRAGLLGYCQKYWLTSTGHRTLPGTPRRVFIISLNSRCRSMDAELHLECASALESNGCERCSRATGQSIFRHLPETLPAGLHFIQQSSEGVKDGSLTFLRLPRQFFGTGRHLRLDQTSLLSLTCG